MKFRHQGSGNVDPHVTAVMTGLFSGLLFVKMAEGSELIFGALNFVEGSLLCAIASSLICLAVERAAAWSKSEFSSVALLAGSCATGVTVVQVIFHWFDKEINSVHAISIVSVLGMFVVNGVIAAAGFSIAFLHNRFNLYIAGN